MSVQENSWSRQRGRKGILLGWILLVALGVALGGCGGSSDEDVTAAKARPPAPCRFGGRVAPHVPDAPAVWSNGPRPAIALTCEPDKVDVNSSIVGYPTKGGGSCVAFYSAPLEEVFGAQCEPDGSDWTRLCEQPGCVHYFQHGRKSTVLVGLVPARVSGVWASIHGKQVIEGVMLATVHGKLMRAIGAKDPFGYFSVYIPRCLEPSEVQVHMVTGGSKQAGLVDEWDVEVAKCTPERVVYPS
ncbi:MAG: hypothetical protein ACTHNY_04270 [Solirubrobacterales bacterium]